MTTIQFSKVKAQLSAFGRLAQAGQTTLVLKHKRPAFIIAPPPSTVLPRTKKPGIALGKGWMAPDFDQTPEDVLKDFEGGA
jgi:antitoxin (DNA-binding transcriptional repressor) of toxin-antitoxin stability system